MHEDSQAANLPIGVFDSGVGGLTVARAIRDLLPHESILYFADSARAPYGPLPLATVREYTFQMLDALVSQGVKLLVIACNTASTAVFELARKRYRVPIVEVIAPTVASAIATTRNGKIGLLGTAATVNSGIYAQFCADAGVELVSQPAPEFVPFVEAGITTGSAVEQAAQKYCAPLLSAGIDTLILGCTHYPFLRGLLRQTVGSGVAIVSSETETANEVYRQLRAANLLRSNSLPPTIAYETTAADPLPFNQLAATMLGINIQAVAYLPTERNPHVTT